MKDIFRRKRISLAKAKATEWHGDQERKYTGVPYVTHPIEVARFLSLFTNQSDILCAAVLHDVLEDTDATREEIRELFGEEVERLVVNMSDLFPLEAGNRATRKEMYRQQVADSCVKTRMIKMADIYSNTKDIAIHDQDFAVVYLAEIWKTFYSIKGRGVPHALTKIVGDSLTLSQRLIDTEFKRRSLEKQLKQAIPKGEEV